MIIDDADHPAVERGRYVVAYGERVSGYWHAYREEGRSRPVVRYARTRDHPPDPRCPGCHPIEDSREPGRWQHHEQGGPGDPRGGLRRVRGGGPARGRGDLLRALVLLAGMLVVPARPGGVGMITDGLFVNPVTYGRTPWIEAWRIALCPICSRPAVSAIDRPPTAAQRMVEYRCDTGHTWRTSWVGQSRMIHREAAPGARPWPGYCQACGAPLDPPDATGCKACGADDIEDD